MSNGRFNGFEGHDAEKQRLKDCLKEIAGRLLDAASEIPEAKLNKLVEQIFRVCPTRWGHLAASWTSGGAERRSVSDLSYL